MHNKRPAYQVISGRFAIVIAFVVFLFAAYNSYFIAAHPDSVEVSMEEDEQEGCRAEICDLASYHGHSELKHPSGPRHKKHYFLHSKKSRKSIAKVSDAGVYYAGTEYAPDKHKIHPFALQEREWLPLPGYYRLLYLLALF